MARLRDEAEAMARALSLGACDLEEVIAWSDAQIAREDQPDGILCEVSLARDQPPGKVAGLLRQLPGNPAEADVAQLLIRKLDEWMTRDADQVSDIAHALFLMHCHDEIEDPDLAGVAAWRGMHSTSPSMVIRRILVSRSPT